MTVLLREAVGERLRRARTAQSRTLRDVSRAARVSLGYLSEVERGRKEASSELLVRSYVVTFGVDAVITRGSNTYGPHQHPEKLIPLFVTNALAGEPLPMYGDGMQIRDWLHVSDHAAGIDFVLRHGEPGEAYNLPGGMELPNRDVIGRLLDATGRDWSLVRTVPDRPGHDRRYAIDGSKIESELGWTPAETFTTGLRKTVEPVRNCRNVGKKDMRWNDALPVMRVDPERYTVEADGVVCEAEPSVELPLAQAFYVY